MSGVFSVPFPWQQNERHTTLPHHFRRGGARLLCRGGKKKQEKITQEDNKVVLRYDFIVERGKSI